MGAASAAATTALRRARKRVVDQPVARLTVDVLCTSTGPLLGDGMPDEVVLDRLVRRHDPPANRRDREVAAEKLYRDPAGKIGFPMEVIFACLRTGGEHVRIASQWVTDEGGTTLAALLDIADTFVPLLVPDGTGGWRQTTDEDWQVDVRFAPDPENRKQRKRVIRPRFDQWAVRIHLKVDLTILDGVTEEAVRRIVACAGTLAGLGGFRTSSNGRSPFGKFAVADWQVRRFDAADREITT